VKIVSKPSILLKKQEIMKKKMMAIALSSILLVGCGSTKNIDPCCAKETKKEIVSADKDPLMQLLVSVIIIYAINIIAIK
tara:strand:- start:657 stop:896 length:240 start_codon:yes stop_codon:yes gene_type:complete